jgi:hypothetical protein
MIIRATKKVLTTNKIKPQQHTELRINNLNEWFVTLLSSGYKGKYFLAYVHSKSLLTIFTEGKSIKQTFNSFKHRLNALLTRSSFPDALITQITEATLNIEAISTTNSRSTLAHINQIVTQVRTSFDMTQTYQDIDLDVEENVVLNMLFSHDKNYFSPTSWWNNYIHGNDPYLPLNKLSKEHEIIKPSTLNKLGLTNEEELHMQNQMLKMDLEQKFGKPIRLNEEDDNHKLPLFIENEFLKHMSAFEQHIRTAKETTVFDLIGKPTFKPAGSITEHKLNAEIKRVVKLLGKHNIIVDFIGEYSPQIIYQFLTVELMEKMISDMRIPGFINHFIYEEFHPNHEIAITGTINMLVNIMFDDEGDLDTLKPHFETDNFMLNDEKATFIDFKNAVNRFHLTHNPEIVLGYETETLKFDELKENVKAQGYIAFKNPIKGKHRIKHRFMVTLKNDEDWWKFTHVFFEPFN